MSTPPWGQEPEPPTSPPPPPTGPSPYQPYGGLPPAPYGTFQPTPQTNGLAIGSLVVSIASIFVCCGLTGVVGAIMGHIARKQIRETGEGGAGLALGGVIVGWVSFGLAVAGVIFYVVAFVALGLWAESVDDCTYNDDGVYVCN